MNIILPNNKYTFLMELPFHTITEYSSNSRLNLYIEKGIDCHACGIRCDRLIIGMDRGGNRHIDLYDAALNVMLTVGHIVPKSLGGGSELANLRPLCHICNYREGNALDHLLKPAMFATYLMGRTVKHKSGKNFENGESCAKIEYWCNHENKKCFKLSNGELIPITKIVFHDT